VDLKQSASLSPPGRSTTKPNAELRTKSLKSRLWWRTEGTKTLEFERAFANYHSTKHCIAVTNGTAAIEVVMAALNIGPGDEVIVPNSTFVATASAVLFAGATPVMVDVLPETDCIDPDLAERRSRRARRQSLQSI